MAGERTEKATPKRRSDERKKGNIFQSKEITTVASLIVMFYALKLFGPTALDILKKAFTDFFVKSAVTESLAPQDIRVLFVQGVGVFAMAALPFLLISSATTVAITAGQTRMLFTTKLLEFKGSRINPLEGFKKMFSLRSLVELVKSLLKITVLGYIIYSSLTKILPTVPRMLGMDFTNAVSLLGGSIMSIVNTVAAIFLFLACFDYGYQWWEYEKSLRMSKQDIKDEYKQTEGDPEVKGKIKEKQRQQAMSRMMQKVPAADLIIRNPTHYAVALQYSPDKNHAPVVVAKGADHLALKIVEVGEKNNIFITENKPLARGLYEAVDLDREIPDKFYQPVAELLAFVYSLKKKEMQR